MPLATVAATEAPPVYLPGLVVHNSPRTVTGGRIEPCSLFANINGKLELHCEVVSSVSGPGATVYYTLTYPNGAKQVFNDIADSRGHSLHPFNVFYRPPLGSIHGQKSTIVTITVTAKLKNGTWLAPVSIRFAVIAP